MIRKFRDSRANAARAIKAFAGRLDVARYTLLQLLGLSMVIAAVGMVYMPLAVGLAGVAIFGVAYFLDADDGDDDDQSRA